MKIIGQLVCGPGEAGRWLEETLKEFARLCDDVVVCLCNATAAEEAMVRRFDFRCYRDDREWGRHQFSIKTGLLQRIHLLRGDWILALDADETVPTIQSRGDLAAISVGREACHFYVVDLWNAPDRYSKTLSFWNIRFYKSDPSRGVQFIRKPVHCGNAPPYFYSLPAKSTFVPHILLHKGLMLPADRLKKAARYELYDPRAIHKGREYYDALVANWSGSEYNQSDVLNKITDYCQRL
jgi:hypothetical protein